MFAVTYTVWEIYRHKAMLLWVEATLHRLYGCDHDGYPTSRN